MTLSPSPLQREELIKSELQNNAERRVFNQHASGKGAQFFLCLTKKKCLSLCMFYLFSYTVFSLVRSLNVRGTNCSTPHCLIFFLPGGQLLYGGKSAILSYPLWIFHGLEVCFINHHIYCLSMSFLSDKMIKLQMEIH